MFSNTACCAFLDSGIGGLPYLHQLKSLSPNTTCVYVADTAGFPYGEKSAEEILSFSAETVRKIINRFNPGAVVIACNTISVTALESLREEFSVPFVGTVPAVKKAAAVSENRIIGLLATERTIDNPYTARLVSDFAGDCKMIFKAASDLISAIENNLVFAHDEKKLEAVKPQVRPFIEEGADTVILGCTHFLHLAQVFREALGADVKIVDSLDGVAQQALRLIRKAYAQSAYDFLAAEQKSKCAFESESKNAAFSDSLFVTEELSESRAETYRQFSKIYGLSWQGVL